MTKNEKTAKKGGNAQFFLCRKISKPSCSTFVEQLGFEDPVVRLIVSNNWDFVEQLGFEGPVVRQSVEQL